MQIVSSRPGRALLAGCALAAALALPGAASARTVKADLRVEDGSKALTSAAYLTDTVSIATDRGCGGSGERVTLNGPTALGLLADGSRATRALRPLAVSDEFEFGLLVCGVAGAFPRGDTSSFWLYKVDHKAPEVGGDVFSLKGGQEVLWYYVDGRRNRNTGDELDIVAPARAERGEAFDVTVYSYDSAGVRKPAANATVVGGAAPVQTDANGVARVTVEREATVRLRATRGADVPTAPTSVCVAATLSECPAVRGSRVFGSARTERIRGTGGADTISAGKGADVVLAGRGADRVNVRGGGRDRVSCGPGRDVVRADRRDRVARSCEVVRPRR